MPGRQCGEPHGSGAGAALQAAQGNHPMVLAVLCRKSTCPRAGLDRRLLARKGMPAVALGPVIQTDLGVAGRLRTCQLGL